MHSKSSNSHRLTEYRLTESSRDDASNSAGDVAAIGLMFESACCQVQERSIADPPQAMDTTNVMLSNTAVDGYIPKNRSSSTAALGGGKSSFQNFVRFADAGVKDDTASRISPSRVSIQESEVHGW